MVIITLTTDFGTSDWYVGCMKGVILGINPQVTLVDITHSCPDQDVLRGSFIISNADYFPEQTIHIIVVDPGVGSDREAIIVKLSNNQFYVCPNNGLLSFLLQKHSILDSCIIKNSEFTRKSLSHTFHGRDIFAPAAAYLSLGVTLSQFGPQTSNFVHLSLSTPRIEGNLIFGEIIYIDKFGNLISNIHKSAVRKKIVLGRVGDNEICNIGEKYSDVGSGQSLILYSSEDYVEVSVNQGNAQSVFSASLSFPITLVLFS